MNEVRESEITYFLDKLKEFEGYPKVRELQKLFDYQLDPIKINTILKYLERSGKIQIDVDGHIIWIRRDNEEVNRISFAEVASISDDFLQYFSTKDQNL